MSGGKGMSLGCAPHIWRIRDNREKRMLCVSACRSIGDVCGDMQCDAKCDASVIDARQVRAIGAKIRDNKSRTADDYARCQARVRHQVLTHRVTLPCKSSDWMALARSFRASVCQLWSVRIASASEAEASPMLAPGHLLQQLRRGQPTHVPVRWDG